jgi:hypothetical protein
VHVSEYSETLRSSCVRGGGIDGYGYGDCPNVWVYLLDSDVDYDTLPILLTIYPTVQSAPSVEQCPQLSVRSKE